mmetsp:Transcript_5536/g.6922  ORF Transcript_5536/g.6922 Transcript_5536/m.6922 type:complete len:572 (+) Transcript_5536:98-1813(+)|eukprot:CAMPEP_0172497786 /NCGR_PEP_ID=MMETSP1066-20121228/105225_1 /TAXON_ID=671091 /ORGANISM="Coscinodiscus wailesii, Strain CCMP2513" /LENGTH=571 /DNA_ID=CAMNT_0013270757 /DNA_START=97 /DNA_END=1812 /DNA_ORIENTATION=+
MSSSNHECNVKLNAEVLKEIGTGDLVGSIDQGTSSTRFMIFSKSGDVVASAQVEHTEYFPSGEDKVGWHEHDPIEIWKNTKKCIIAACTSLSEQTISPVNLEKTPLKAIGITNQRETTIAWNAKTGVPYHKAIVWDDLRTTKIAHRLSEGGGALPAHPGGELAEGECKSGVDRLRARTGLPLVSYFAGTKVRWLIDNVPQLRRDLEVGSGERENVRFGTIDTWLVYQLTGESSGHEGNVGGMFLTDVTNASRWLFMNINNCEWDEEAIGIMCGEDVQMPLSALPEIRASSEVYGACSEGCGVEAVVGVPVAAILGDQQAALFGQSAFTPGEAKCTYGTGIFLLMNTGTLVPSTHGLLTTIAYKIGSTITYALEGSVSHSGSTIQWLRDHLQIINSAPESETLASTTTSNDGLYFVPAFSGLFAPYWRSDARGCIVGMTASHGKGHICRAALEASAYQTRELFEAIDIDSGVNLEKLKVDGGATANKLLMQFQSDMIGVEVIRPKCMETTAMGAAFAAGLAVGVWDSLEEIRSLWAVDKTWKPTMSAANRDKNWNGWKKAVTKSFDWVEDDK